MINNRQAGRRRGRGGNNNGGPRPNGGQRDNGNRIDSRARGNANQLYEKYKNLAADSQRQGDRVTTEYYLQFADHYFRVLSESRARFEEQNQRRDGYEAKPFTGSFDTGFDNQDDEYGDEGEPIRAGEQQGGGDRGPRNDRDDRRNGGPNGQQPRRDDQPRGDRQRDDRPREDRQDRQRDDRPREDRYRAEGRRDEQGERPQRDEMREGGEGRRPRRQRDDAAPALVTAEAARPVEAAPVEQPVAAETPAGQAPAEGAEAPRRRGRPRRERPADEAPATFDATVLPPSLGIAPAASEVAADTAEKPRRRRVRAATPEASAAE